MGFIGFVFGVIGIIALGGAMMFCYFAGESESNDELKLAVICGFIAVLCLFGAGYLIG